jgi:hypothetical protein
VLQIDYRHIARGIMGLHTNEETDDSMTNPQSLDPSCSLDHGSIDVAKRTFVCVSAEPSPATTSVALSPLPANVIVLMCARLAVNSTDQVNCKGSMFWFHACKLQI